jgi:hypothetical protein
MNRLVDMSILEDTAISIIIEGQFFQIFQRFSSSKLILNTVESRFTALNHYENGSMNLKKPGFL